MGTFRIEVTVANISDATRSRLVSVSETGARSINHAR
jgi:hypothetical protein